MLKGASDHESMGGHGDEMQSKILQAIIDALMSIPHDKAEAGHPMAAKVDVISAKPLLEGSDEEEKSESPDDEKEELLKKLGR